MYGLEFFTELRLRRVQKPLAHRRIIKSSGQLLHDRVRLCLMTRRLLHLLAASIIVRKRRMDFPGGSKETDLVDHLKRPLESLFSTVSIAAGRQALSDYQRSVGDGLLPPARFRCRQNRGQKLTGSLGFPAGQMHSGKGHVGVDTLQKGPTRWDGELPAQCLSLDGQCLGACGAPQEPIGPGEHTRTA